MKEEKDGFKEAKKNLISLGRIIIILIICVWGIIFVSSSPFLKKKRTKEDTSDPQNAPGVVRNFMNDTNIGVDGKINSSKSIKQLWEEMRNYGNDILQYLDSPDELANLIQAAQALDFPDTRENPDEPINWKNIDLDSTEIQGIVKFKRAMEDGNSITMSYVTPSKLQELMNKYMETGKEKDKQEALKHFTIEKTFSASDGTSTAVDPLLQETLQYACSWVDKIPYKSYASGDGDNNERHLPLKEGRASDCSWFVFRVFEHTGLMKDFCYSRNWGKGGGNGGCPGTEKKGTDLSQASPGDVLWWHGNSGESWDNHVAIYLGKNKMVECSGGKGGVVISDVKQNSGIDQILHFSQFPTDPNGYFDPDTMTLHSSLVNSGSGNIAKVSSLRGMVFLGDSILASIVGHSRTLKNEGAIAMHQSGCRPRFFLGEETVGGRRFNWNKEFSTIKNPTGFYLLLGQNSCHDKNNRIKEMDKLIQKIKSSYPSAPIYMSSVLYHLDRDGSDKRAATAMNEELKVYCAGQSNVYYSDILRGYNDNLKEMSYDNDHPNTKGSEVLINNIKQNIIGTNSNNTITNNTTNYTSSNTNTTIANTSRTYNNDVLNVDKNFYINPVKGTNGAYRAVQSACYDGRCVISTINKNVGNSWRTSNYGGRISWHNLETGKLEATVEIGAEGGHMDGIAFDSDRNIVLKATNSKKLIQIDNNTKKIASNKYVEISERCDVITYVPTIKRLVGIDGGGNMKFYVYNQSQNKYTKEKQIKMEKFKMKAALENIGTDGQVIYIADSYPDTNSSKWRVWTYTLDGKLAEEHAMGSGFIGGNKHNESVFGDKNGNLWIACSQNIQKVTNYKSNPMGGSSGGTSTSTVTYTTRVPDSGKYDVTNCFSPETQRIVDAHRNDFNINNFKQKMQQAGGFESYVRSLGGVFTKYIDKKGYKVQNAGEFQEICEYTFGLMTIWGFDYGNGVVHRSWGGRATPQIKSGAFYPHGTDNSYREYQHINDACSNVNNPSMKTNCNTGVNMLLETAGLAKNSQHLADGKRNGAKKIIYNKSELQVGDIIHFYRDSGRKSWHHAAIVGEVDKERNLLTIYDFAGRFIESGGRYKLTCPIDDSKDLGNGYSHYWCGVRWFDLDQSVNVSNDETSTNEYNSKYQVIVPTWNEHQEKVESTDPEVQSYDTGLIHEMTTTTIPYQPIVSKYKMPFNYIYTMLVYGEDKDFAFDLAQLVKNSRIEITIHDNVNRTKNVSTDTYTDVTKINAHADSAVVGYIKNVYDALRDSYLQGPSSTVTGSTTVTDLNASGTKSKDRKVVHTTIYNTNYLDIALTLADSWYTKYEKRYTYNEPTVDESNSTTKQDDKVIDEHSESNLGGLDGKIDGVARGKALTQVSDINRTTTVGNIAGKHADFKTTRTKRVNNLYIYNKTSSYIPVPATNSSTVSSIATPKTGSLDTNNFATLPHDSLPNIQEGFCLIGDNLYAVSMMNNSGGRERSKVYLLDMATFTVCDTVSNLNGHGNSLTYDTVTGDLIYPEKNGTTLIHVDTSAKRFGAPRKVNTPAHDQIAYNKHNDLFITYNCVYTRQQFYANGKAQRVIPHKSPHSGSVPQAQGTYGNQVYFCHSAGNGNYIIVSNIHTGAKEKVIFDNTHREIEELDFTSDGTMYIMYGGGGKNFRKTDYNYFADNDIDKSNVSPVAASNSISMYNTGGKYIDKSTFEGIFNSNYTASNNILGAKEQFFSALEQNADTKRMVDLTKYLFYKATGIDYGVTTFDFEAYQLEDIGTVNNGGGTTLDITSCSLSKEQFIQLTQSYSAAISKGSGTKVFRDNAAIIYDVCTKNKINPVLCAAQAWQEQNWDDPNTSPYNFWGIAVYNGQNYGKSWANIEQAVQGYCDQINSQLNGKMKSTYQETARKFSTVNSKFKGDMTTIYDVFSAYAYIGKGHTLQEEADYAASYVEKVIKCATQIYGEGVLTGGVTGNSALQNLTSEQKVKILFPNGIPQSEQQLKPYLTEISVPITRKNGTKTTMGVEVHKAIAQDVYNACLAAQNSGFKIYDIGGYRTFGTDRAGKTAGLQYSQHCYGLAVDINPTENGEFRGGAATGNWFYAPGTNEYSIPSDSVLVKTFKSMGWGWGGEWHSSKDYMHFSVMGT